MKTTQLDTEVTVVLFTVHMLVRSASREDISEKHILRPLSNRQEIHSKTHARSARLHKHEDKRTESISIHCIVQFRHRIEKITTWFDCSAFTGSV